LIILLSADGRIEAMDTAESPKRRHLTPAAKIIAIGLSARLHLEYENLEKCRKLNPAVCDQPEYGIANSLFPAPPPSGLPVA
jgi:hypothetical protein